MATQILHQISAFNVVDSQGLWNRAGRFFNSMASAMSSYFGPWNLDILHPRFRARLSVEEMVKIDATFYGLGHL